MKRKRLAVSLFVGLMLCTGFTSCGDDNEDDGNNFDMTKLVGSEWSRDYFYANEDDGSIEEGTHTLTFTSSTQAEDFVSYHGKNWEWNPDTDMDEYKSYSGTSTTLYTYEVSGNTVTMLEEGSDYAQRYTISGNKMKNNQSPDEEWALVKAGSGSAEGGSGSGGEDPAPAYTWANMKGIWMEADKYGSYKSALDTYEQQHVSSDVLLRNSSNGDFSVGGYQINANGELTDVWVCTKTWHNAIVLKTIATTSDHTTVYWTDIENDKSGEKLTIRDNKIYYNGNVRFEIFSPKMMMQDETLYEKVQ